MPPENTTNDLTDTRPMVYARTISHVTIALSVLAYVIFKIFVCGCQCLGDMGPR